MEFIVRTFIFVLIFSTENFLSFAQHGLLVRPNYGIPGSIPGFPYQHSFAVPRQIDPRFFFHGLPGFIYEYLPLLPKFKTRDAALDFVAGANPNLRGYLEFYQAYNGVYITGQISGLAPGYHGFHVHENGNLGDACRSAGGHFNPFMAIHGSPTSRIRHVGDLGNIFADHTGTAHIKIFDSIISLDKKSHAFIGNRAIVVHALPDDLGRGGDDESVKTGNAGAREGCGIIYLQSG